MDPFETEMIVSIFHLINYQLLVYSWTLDKARNEFRKWKTSETPSITLERES